MPDASFPILRLVDMTFKREHQAAFLELFAEHREAIAAMPGCGGVELLERREE